MTQETVERLAARVRELEEQAIVPGAWECPACAFYQVNTVLDVKTGVMGADTESVPLCPNDQSLMRRVTWRELVQHYGGTVDDLRARVLDLEAQKAKQFVDLTELEGFLEKQLEERARRLAQIRANLGI